MRPAYARSERNTPAVVTTPTTQAVSHKTLGAICAKGVVNIDIRVPQKPKKIKVDGGRKRKTPKPKDPVPKGNVTGHYLRFVSNTMNYMDEVPEMKGFYLFMDNAPIHTSDEIRPMIENRGYQCVYLPPYSPELNPIEQFWAIVKNKDVASSRIKKIYKLE
jgi:hypothetical protein